MGGKRNLVLGRCAGVLFMCGAIASLPANALLGSPDPDFWVYPLNALAAVSGFVCLLTPWHRLHRRWLHVIVFVAIVEVTLAVVAHESHGSVFMWYFVLTGVFAAYAFRRRANVLFHLGTNIVGMVGAGIYVSTLDRDAIANTIVAVPTVTVAAGVVVWLRENLERRERTDPLTGLANRRALMEELETSGPALLALFDLDGFKRYNDRLGHAAGDALLERLGARLSHAVAGSGVAYRLGGDELCVLLTDDSALGACSAALREGDITASYGTARLPDEADTPSTALSLADDRMYAAKRASRDAPFVVELVTEREWGTQSPPATTSPAGSPEPPLSTPH